MSKKESKKMGRPLIQIDWETVEKLCAIQCTGEEIAGVLGICYDTLETAIKREHKLTFSDYFKQKSAVGKISLRRSQYQNATERMNATMQIWLGKQWLGQTDTQQQADEDRLQKTIEAMRDVAEIIRNAE